MNLSELMEKTGWQCVAGGGELTREVSGAYCGDLLSWVMGNGKPGQAWITVQVHMNVVAVAVLREFSCVIIADNAVLPDDVKERAEDEGLPVLQSGLPVYETAKILVGLDI